MWWIPERELARIHQVSLMTARHALTSLEREGIVEGGAAPELRGAAQDPFQQADEFTPRQMASRGLVACSRLCASS
jgi:DNA-binding transcriptional regulator YhcF (GntR family)